MRAHHVDQDKTLEGVPLIVCVTAQDPSDDILILSGCSCFDKGVTCIFEEVLLELVGVLLLVHVTVHLLKVLPMIYSSSLDAPGLKKVRHVLLKIFFSYS